MVDDPVLACKSSQIACQGQNGYLAVLLTLVDLGALLLNVCKCSVQYLSNRNVHIYRMTLLSLSPLRPGPE